MGASRQNATLFVNGRFFKGKTDLLAFHENMLVEDGKISYIGPSTSPILENNRNVATEDLEGQYVLPGFLDGHMHLLLLGQSLAKLNLNECESIDEIRHQISKFAKEHPEKKRILCMGWMHSMTNGEAKAVMLDDLDPRPIYIDSKDLHSVWCNSAALAEMGVQEMNEPAGGIIERDEQGIASGLLSEACVLQIVWPHLARVFSTEERMGALKAAIAAYHEVGCTGCIDMAMDENAWEALLALQRAEGGNLAMRVAAHWCILPGEGEEHRLKQVERAIELAHQHCARTSPDLRVVGIKIICDGVIDACTAALAEPYTSNALSPDPIWTPEMLGPVVKRASDAGLQIALHAIGDQAVHNAINALEEHGKPGQRHRIEHLELTKPADAARLSKLGITASIQPVHSDPAILRAWSDLLGPKRLQRAFAYKEFMDHGAVLAIGSDSPTAPHAPLRNLYVATTRKSARNPAAGDEPVNENFKLGIVEAVNGATKGVAYSCFAEDRVGTLEVGKSADFVVIDMEFTPAELLEAKVTQTWFAGKKVYGK
jgi:predicted amidohydrolase YtcJ